MPDSILIAEDNPAARVGLQQLLRGWGFEVEAAADGDEALQKVVLKPPTIVLTDMVMPRMGGIELLKSVKQHDPSVTVVILTAQGSIETAIEAMRDGAYDYLMKPVDPQRLRIVIDQILDRGRTQREVARQLAEVGDADQSGRAAELAREAKQLAQALEQGAVDPSVLERQQRLFRRMLDAGRTLENDKQDESAKRESRPGDQSNPFLPPNGTATGRAVVKYRTPDWNELRGLSPEERRLVIDIGGGSVFAPRVHHPGSRGRRFLRDSLEYSRPLIYQFFREATMRLRSCSEASLIGRFEGRPSRLVR